MNSIPESWIQSVVEAAGLPPASPEVVNVLLPTIELQIRKIIQQAAKFQKRGKSSTLKVEDINLALTTNKLEPVYGLHMWRSTNSSSTIVNGDKPSLNDFPTYVNISDFCNVTLPDVPLKPVLALHWLAVNGTQPSIPENPSLVQSDIDNQPVNLAKELQFLYARITGILLNAESSKSLDAVYSVLQEDHGLQELVPYLSRFFYLQVKANTRNLRLLNTICRAINALHRNQSVSLEAHLQQLLPAVFTCIVAAKLSNSNDEDHWTLRQYAASIIADLSRKYSATFPDLHARICKTYLEAISADKPLVTVYGGIVGIGALGHSVIRSLLLGKLQSLRSVLEKEEQEVAALVAVEPSDTNEEEVTRKRPFGATLAQKTNTINEKQLAIAKCKEAMQATLGRYITMCMQLPSLPWKNQQLAAIKASDSYELCDLEESLVPYFATLSKELYHSRMAI